MATSSELTAIVRSLNTVKSAGQVRAAIGAALNALHEGYKLVPRISNADLRSSSTRSLDSARLPLEAWYKSITAPGNVDYSSEWAKNRAKVERAYVEVAGVEGMANHKPQTSLASILATSIKEAPGVFVKQAAAAVGAVGAAAGDVVGSTIGGLFSGLGPVGLAVLVVVLILVVRGSKGSLPIVGGLLK